MARQKRAFKFIFLCQLGLLGLCLIPSAKAYTVENGIVSFASAPDVSVGSAPSFQVDSSVSTTVVPDSNFSFSDNTTQPDPETETGGSGTENSETEDSSSSASTISYENSFNGRGRYDASNWILQRKYDELVAQRDAQLIVEEYPKLASEDFHVSAPDSRILIQTEASVLELEQAPSRVASLPDTSVPIVYEERIVDERTTKIDEAIINLLHEPSTQADPVMPTRGDIVPPLSLLQEDLLIQEITRLRRTLQVVLLILIVLLTFQVLRYQKERKTRWRFRNLLKKHSNFFSKKQITRFMLWGLVVVLFSSTLENVFAAQRTTPSEKIYYQGSLKDNQGNYVTGNYDFRFSFWNTEDYIENNDVLNGVIQNTTTFLHWSETQSLNLTNGKFSFVVGDVKSIPSRLFDQVNLYLQVEIKKSTDPKSDFELIDSDPADAAKDRAGFSSVPYASNADKLDFHESGFGADEIPFLDANGLLPSSTIPNETNQNSFILDKDNDAEVISLIFGETLAKTLSWNNLLSRFEFNDSLYVSGDLVVSGTINGVPVGKVLYSEKLTPRYPNSIFVADGTNNDGSMHEEREVIGTDPVQVLRWSTAQSNFQDYDIQIHYTLPSNFLEFETADQIRLTFETNGNHQKSKIDFTIEKLGESGDNLSGNGLGLNSNDVNTSQNFSLDPATEWAAGDTLILQIKMYATQGFDTKISTLQINYNSR